MVLLPAGGAGGEVLEEGNSRRNEGVEDVVRPREEEEEGDCNAAEVDVGVRRRRAHSGDAVIHLMSSASSSSSSTLRMRGLGDASYRREDGDGDGAVAHLCASHVRMYAYAAVIGGDDGVAGGDSMSRKSCRRVEVRVTVPAVKAVTGSFVARAPHKRFSANAEHSAEHGPLLSSTANHQRRMPRESDAGSDSEQEMSAVLAPAYI